MENVRSRLKTIKRKYYQLVKSLQTALLLITGIAGYMSARCPVHNIPTVLGLAGSLLLSISGSTVLNMWYDRDIDAIMPRTCKRPLSTGETKPKEALIFGLISGYILTTLLSRFDSSTNELVKSLPIIAFPKIVIPHFSFNIGYRIFCNCASNT